MAESITYAEPLMNQVPQKWALQLAIRPICSRARIGRTRGFQRLIRTPPNVAQSTERSVSTAPKELLLWILATVWKSGSHVVLCWQGAAVTIG
jgi:hypothetical protein